ncbi:hypothetical protein F383_19102 [Gossypium arboreum]|uniref:Uncharacterized protein n=1 Tax=Gossypium arboreum TaxID=29729 RepID=A0A0B0NQA0_GOSAR|nr:hypothetical protein F383_19102 [Gossypium arboreum]
MLSDFVFCFTCKTMFGTLASYLISC